MLGKMMFQPLLISDLIDHAARYHADTPIISKSTNGEIIHSNWHNTQINAKKFAHALQALGLNQGDRVATIAWNNHRHLESWYAISGSGLVCHTINPRLFPEQLIFIVNDAQDQVILFDKTFLPLINAVKTHLKTVKYFICLEAEDLAIKEALPEVLFYDDLLAEAQADFTWPLLNENTASSLCYTSGTTGHPKGVLYSHRSTVLHSFASTMPDLMNLSARDIMLPVVPMFHVNAWGTPYSAAMVGCTMVLPGPGLDGVSLVKLIDDYQVTVALGVPTIWQGLLSAADQVGSTLDSLQRNIVGGSACPPSMLKLFKEKYQCETIHAWGMSETSPLGSCNQLKAKHLHLSPEQQLDVRVSQGRPPFGISLRLADHEGGTQEIEANGEYIGHLQIKGHWVIDSYFGQEKSALTVNGWFDTGDIASVDQDGFLTIRDRAKDLIKSGGEWISSVELENLAMGHPAITMAAVIAAEHEKWDERPVLIAVKKPDHDVTEDELLAYYSDKVAKWQIPDQVIFVETIPLSGTGKMLKRELRSQYGQVLLKNYA